MKIHIAETAIELATRLQPYGLDDQKSIIMLLTQMMEVDGQEPSPTPLAAPKKGLEPGKWYSQNEAAAALGVIPHTVYLRARNGTLERRGQPRNFEYRLPTAGARARAAPKAVEKIDPNHWYKPSEAARLLGISVDALGYRARAGKYQRRMLGPTSSLVKLTPPPEAPRRVPAAKTAAKPKTASKNTFAGPGTWLSMAAAAAALGLTEPGVYYRGRQGLLKTRPGKDGGAREFFVTDDALANRKAKWREEKVKPPSKDKKVTKLSRPPVDQPERVRADSAGVTESALTA